MHPELHRPLIPVPVYKAFVEELLIVSGYKKMGEFRRFPKTRFAFLSLFSLFNTNKTRDFKTPISGIDSQQRGNVLISEQNF